MLYGWKMGCGVRNLGVEIWELEFGVGGQPEGKLLRFRHAPRLTHLPYACK